MKSAHAFALAAVFAAESVVFCVVTSHRDAWIYPRWFDQMQYLREAYDGYEQAAQNGFGHGVRQAFFHGSPQGSLHAVLALLAFEMVGPSRAAALSLNLAAFLALQAATFLAVRRLAGSWPIAWAAVGLLAGLHFPWSGGPASAVDFRLDWMAACAYGVALAVGLAGQGFRSKTWSVLFGVAVGAVILTRYLTAVYFALIYAALLCSLLFQRDRRSRCWHAVLSGLVALAICAPAFWRSRAAIYSYYWIGHFAGPERGLRDAHLGILSSVGWILSDVLLEQVGLAAAAVGLAAAVALLVAGSRRGVREESTAPARPLPGSAWFLIVAFLAAPAAVLAVHPQKASPAVSILIPGAVWVLVLVWLRLARRASQAAVAAVGGAVVIAGGVLFAVAETSRRDSAGMVAQYRDVNGLADYLYFRSEEAGLSRPRVAVTWLLDGLGARSFDIVGYERHHGPLRFVETLPTGLFAATPDTVMRRLADSDFVCLVTRAAPAWPFDRRIADLLPEMRAWCDRNLGHVGDLDAAEFSALIYERPNLARLRPEGGVVLAEMIRAASRGPAYAKPVPPSPPVFLPAAILLGSAKAEFRRSLAVAYSPVRLRANGLPEGLQLDPASGEIRGLVRRPGLFSARITATNPSGSTVADIVFHFEDQASFAQVSAPGSCAAGAPVEIGFGAFDSAGKLDFLDVTDLTAGKQLGRLEAAPDQKQAWTGKYRLSFERPGPRTILLRFVRFDGAAREPYSFLDKRWTVEVRP